jgi:hypothetical protein
MSNGKLAVEAVVAGRIEMIAVWTVDGVWILAPLPPLLPFESVQSGGRLSGSRRVMASLLELAMSEDKWNKMKRQGPTFGCAQ